MEIGTALPRVLRGIVMPSRGAGVTSLACVEEEAAGSRDVNTAVWKAELEDGAAAASKVWILEFMLERDD